MITIISLVVPGGSPGDCRDCLLPALLILNCMLPIAAKTAALCVAWYLVLLLTSQLTKVILMTLPLPFLLLWAQFALGAVLLLCMLRLGSSVAGFFPPGTVGQKAAFDRSTFMKVLPLGVCQFVGKYLLLCALSLIPIAAVASVKALLPLMIVLGYRTVYKVRFPLVTYLSLTLLLCGVLLLISADASIAVSVNEQHLQGLLFCGLSTAIMAGQHIYGKELLTWKPDQLQKMLPCSSTDLVYAADCSKPDKFSIIFHISLSGFAFALGGFLWNETSHVHVNVPSALLFALVALNCVSHFMQTVFAFMLLGSVPALTYLIASMMKRVFVIVVSIVWVFDGNSVKWLGGVLMQQAQGLTLLGAGLYCYNRWGSRRLQEY